MCPQSRFSSGSGFTLIELVVVITVLSLVVLLVIPKFPETKSARLRSSARSFAAAVRYLGDRAVTVKISYRMHLNLADGTVSVNRINASGEEAPTDDPFLSRGFLADGVVVEDVELQRLGKVVEGEVTIDFGGSGLEEFMIIHLRGAGSAHFTVMAFPQNGKVKVLEGYKEFTL
jgi:general secretion pathway protein H